MLVWDRYAIFNGLECGIVRHSWMPLLADSEDGKCVVC